MNYKECAQTLRACFEERNLVNVCTDSHSTTNIIYKHKQNVNQENTSGRRLHPGLQRCVVW
jgi:hypothetical protein